MNIRNWITAEGLVNALNVQPLDRLERQRFGERYYAAGGTLPRKETLPFATALLSAELRTFVDSWLESGVGPDGSESPSNRHLFGNLFWIAQGYLEKYPPIVALDPRTGVTVVLAQPVKFASEAWGTGQLYAATNEEAQRLFAGLVVSDWREALCKCRYPPCGRYFLLAKPRKVRRRGTFCCRQHQARTSAAARTKELRVTANRELVEFAAKWLTDWGMKSAKWVDDARLRRRLARALSVHVSRNPLQRARRQRIEAKWVTRHRQAIEQQRKAGNG